MPSSEWHGFTLHHFLRNYSLLKADEAELVVLNVAQLEVQWKKKHSQAHFRDKFEAAVFEHPVLSLAIYPAATALLRHKIQASTMSW